MYNNLHARLFWVIIQFNVVLQHFIKTLFTVNKSATTNKTTKYSPDILINAAANSGKTKVKIGCLRTHQLMHITEMAILCL